MTQRQIAQKLGISSHASINRIFKENGWQARPAAPSREEADSVEVYRLYFREGKSMKEVAKLLGLKGISPIRRIFREMGWKSRGGSYTSGKRRQFQNDDERILAKKENDNAQFQKIKKLRIQLFGTECKICGTGKDERLLAIHRKDFKEHKQNQLWIKGYLQSLNPDEWVALCVACHRGVHWLKEKHDMKWTEIEYYLDRMSQANQLIAINSTRSRHKKQEQHIEGNVEQIRHALFGKECHFCGDDIGNRRLTIHRKDGRPHRSSLLWSKGNLVSLDSDEWITLCQKCHRYVHWAEDNLCLSWNDMNTDSFSSDIQGEDFVPSP
ncbi:MAG: hypothetical protein RTU30_09185 [Candidatus Thorarchaeota archaeon]